MSNPRELPILFNAGMVRAILAGTKTQTRRPFKQQPPVECCTGDVAPITDGKRWAISRSKFCKDGAGAWPPGTKPGIKPQYQIGDRLYVRERAKALIVSSDYIFGGQGKAIFRYEADRSQSGWVVIPKRLKPIKQGHCLSNGCFKEAARIWLEVVDVRVERVNEISEADAMAEGIRKVSKDGELFKYCIYDHSDYSSVPWSEMPKSPRPVFETLWDSIYMNWHKNPWVFVYEFKEVSHR